MTERAKIEAAIAALEAQRGVLGDAVAELALAPLRAKLQALQPASQPAHAAEQQLKQATVLFTDIVGSTSLSQHLDPEDIHAVMDGALERFTTIVARHKGRVLQYAGDSMLAVFGAEGAHEDDPERAVRTGLAVIEAAKELSAAVEARHGHSGFGVRVGISTGPVLLGGGVDDENSVRGISVNTAARMEQTAPPGGLRISHDTYRHVRGVFDVVEQPPLLVKGRDEPLVTYFVLRPKARAFRIVTRGIEGVETRMVGRDAELEALQDDFHRVCGERRLAATLVVGEAGVGKSRLLYEFENWAEAQAQMYFVFRGRAQPLTEQQPYGLLRDVLSWRLQINDSDSSEEARHKLVSVIAPLFGNEGEAQAQVLGHLIGMDFSGSPQVRALLDDARQLRNRAFHVAAQTLRRMTEQSGHPSLVVLDDLHWADEGSLDFINYLMQVNRDVPSYLLCMTRPALFERRSSWASLQGSLKRIDLDALDKRASRELALELLKRLPAVPAALRDLLTSTAEGNPFHMEELVKMLIDDGAIVSDADGWRVVPERLVAARVPPTLTGVLQSRLDSLPLPERRALQQASVIGVTFWDRTLAAIEPNAVEQLAPLTTRELTLPVPSAANDDLHEFAFRNQALHQVTYDSVLKRERREYHARIANWLAGLSGDRAAETSGLAAEHFEQAGQTAQAGEYFTRAAEHAAQRYASQAVIGYVQRALALAPADDLALRWRLLLVREKVLRVGEDRPAHARDLEELERIAARLGDRSLQAEAAFCRCASLIIGGEYGAAEASGNEALLLAVQAQAHGLAALVACALADSLIRQGRHDEAQSVLDERLDQGRGLGERKPDEAPLLLVSGLIAMERGDLLRGVELFERTLAMDRRSGNLRRQSIELNNLGAIHALLGNYGQARRRLDEGLGISRTAGRRDLEASILLNLASASSLEGDDASTLAYAHQAFGVATAIGQRDLVAYARLVEGHAELALGRYAEARAAYAASRELIEALQMRPQQVLDPVAGLARVALAEGKVAEALEHAERIVAHIDAGGSFDGTEEPLRPPLTCLKVLQAAGDARAAKVLAYAHGELMRLADRMNDAAARQGFLHNVPHHREILALWRRHEQAAAA